MLGLHLPTASSLTGSPVPLAQSPLPSSVHSDLCSKVKLNKRERERPLSPGYLPNLEPNPSFSPASRCPAFSARDSAFAQGLFSILATCQAPSHPRAFALSPFCWERASPGLGITGSFWSWRIQRLRPLLVAPPEALSSPPTPALPARFPAPPEMCLFGFCRCSVSRLPARSAPRERESGLPRSVLQCCVSRAVSGTASAIRRCGRVGDWLARGRHSREGCRITGPISPTQRLLCPNFKTQRGVAAGREHTAELGQNPGCLAPSTVHATRAPPAVSGSYSAGPSLWGQKV